VKSPEHSVAVAAAEARLVVDHLVGGHLLHLVHALATLVTRSIVLHHSRPDGRMDAEKFYIPPNTHTRLTALFRDYPGQQVPER